MWLDNAHLGECSVDRQDALAGQHGTWTFTYVTGSYGIEDSGALRLAWRMVSDWEMPQFTDKTKSGYSTLTTSSGAELSITYDRFLRPYTNSLLIRVVRGSLKPGDTVTLTLGEKKYGAPGIRAQAFAEPGHVFRFYVDPSGSDIFRQVGEDLHVPVLPGMPHKLHAMLPGTVEVGKPFALTVCCLDDMGNPCPHFKGKVALRALGAAAEGVIVPAEADFTQATGGVLRLEGCRAAAEGEFRVEVSSREELWRVISTPAKAEVAPGLRLYWGDMHGQNANTLGTGTMDDYYSYGRNVGALDFSGWQGNDFEITNESFRNVREKTKEYLEEGRFVPFLGYEWSGSTPAGGDYNIFFRDDSETFYPSNNWISYPNANVENICNPLPELWKKLKGRDDVLAIPHVGGRCGNLDYLSEEFCPAVEVHSHHGIFDWFALSAMRRRLKVGFVASSDDHTCHMGLFFPIRGTTPSGGFDVAAGYCGLWAEEHTKEALWKALRARHCYASTIDRIRLSTALDSGAFMGDECILDAPTVLRAEAVGRYPIDQILIYDWEKQIADLRPRGVDKSRVRIRWRGVVVGGKHKSTNWDGFLTVEEGRIRTAENYAIDRDDQGIQMKTSGTVSWRSTTTGDYDGVILTLGGADPVIRFHCTQGSYTLRLSELEEKGSITVPMGTHCSLEIDHPAPAAQDENCAVNVEWPVAPDGEEHAYWVKVIEDNGNAAWASPIFTSGQ